MSQEERRRHIATNTYALNTSNAPLLSVEAPAGYPGGTIIRFGATWFCGGPCDSIHNHLELLGSLDLEV